LNLSIGHLRAEYLTGRTRPADLLGQILERIPEHAEDNIWIRVLKEDELRPYLKRLEGASPEALPLYGIPFAIKDNIDLAGVPTTAGCPAYSYVPQQSAFVVQRLIEAGAIPVGKTNLDQFATGLVGTRSPYGTTRNPFRPDYISGGSSSGSAVALARGLVSFALGTDTAGSGRVPAAFNNLVGIKPTRGLLSNRGMVPACRSLDCVSLFALDLPDAQSVQALVATWDSQDPYARVPEAGPAPRRAFRFGVPEQLEFLNDGQWEGLYRAAAQRLQGLGGQPVRIDFEPFLAAASLLYEGPWVAERYAAIQPFIESRPEALHPVTRAIIQPAIRATAVQAFQAQYRLQALKRRADALLADLDLVLIPSAPTIYTIAEVEEDPIRLDGRLGLYTNFMNLLDYAAIAVPAGFDSRGLPFGVTLFGPAFSDRALAVYADRLHRAAGLPLGATGRCTQSAPLAEPVGT